jgi:hypothetical protein
MLSLITFVLVCVQITLNTKNYSPLTSVARLALNRNPTAMQGLKLFAGTSQNFTPSTYVHTEVRRTYGLLPSTIIDCGAVSINNKKIF